METTNIGPCAGVFESKITLQLITKALVVSSRNYFWGGLVANRNQVLSQLFCSVCTLKELNYKFCNC